MPPTGPQSNSSLRDNRTHRGTVGDFLKSEIQPGSHLSFVSAYFTVHAYEALASPLEGAAKLQFLFGEPSFVTGIERGDKEKANFKLTEHGISIAKTLTQRPAAKACAEWIERMVEIRSIRQSNFLHGKPSTSKTATRPAQSSEAPISPSPALASGRTATSN